MGKFRSLLELFMEASDNNPVKQRRQRAFEVDKNESRVIFVC